MPRDSFSIGKNHRQLHLLLIPAHELYAMPPADYAMPRARSEVAHHHHLHHLHCPFNNIDVVASFPVVEFLAVTFFV